VKNCLTFRRPGALALGVWAVLAGFATAPHVSGQAVAVGSIAGSVIDPAGAAVTGVQLTVKNLANNKTLTATSSAAGTYSVENLAPGSYEIVAAKYGFSEAKTRVVLAAGRKKIQADLKLKLAEVAENTASDPDAKKDAKKIDALEDRIGELEQEVQAKDNQSTGTSAPPPTLLASRSAEASTLPGLPSVKPKPSAKDILLEPLPPSPDAGPTPAPQAAAAAPAQAAAPDTPAPVDLVTPFADHDWTWLNGNSRQHDYPLDTKYFSPEFRADTFYVEDTNQPIDHTMGGSSEIFRNNEVQLEDLSIGGDFHDGQMRGRVLALFGMFAATTARNDASPSVGQWDVDAAYRYVSEAYGGYHFNWQHGLNIDAGIFVSYVGLFSYHNFDNWAYQPSYVSSNTPWFFNGVRVQWFPSHHLKIEPWFINGWQSYNRYNGHPGLGGQLKWTPKEWLNVIANQYGVGNDNVGLPNRGRYHTDNSVEVKYFDKPTGGNGLDRMAFTFTGDVGCETGDGVTCHGSKLAYNPVTGAGGPRQDFVGWMAYNRWWWAKDTWGFTLGGGWMTNPGRYLTLVLPINGATASTGTPYFPAYPGAPMKAYDSTATWDWMPNQFTTFRWEAGYRHANVPYFSGRHGSTPPGGNNGSPADFVCASGASSGATDLPDAEVACGGGKSSVWFPDLREGQLTFSMMIMVKL
jgi:hypothetical protein